MHRGASQKACYPTKLIALDAAEVMMEKGWVHPGCHITPYRCPDCGQWHVGNRQIVRFVHVYTGLLLPVPVLLAILGSRGARLRRDLGTLNRWTSGDARWFRR